MGLCGCNLKEELDCLKTSNDLTSNTHRRSGDRLKICRIVEMKIRGKDYLFKKNWRLALLMKGTQPRLED